MVFRYVERAQDKLQAAGPYLLWERQYKMIKVLVQCLILLLPLLAQIATLQCLNVCPQKHDMVCSFLALNVITRTLLKQSFSWHRAMWTSFVSGKSYYGASFVERGVFVRERT